MSFLGAESRSYLANHFKDSFINPLDPFDSLEHIRLSFYQSSLNLLGLKRETKLFFVIPKLLNDTYVLPLDPGTTCQCIIVLTQEEWSIVNFSLQPQLLDYHFLVISSSSRAFAGRCDSTIMRRKAALYFANWNKISHIVMIDGDIQQFDFRAFSRAHK